MQELSKCGQSLGNFLRIFTKKKKTLTKVSQFSRSSHNICFFFPRLAELTTREPETSAPSSDPPGGPNTQAKASAKLRNPTPRLRGVSAWVIILIVLGAMAIVFIAVFLLYRWNHRYSGSFKPSKNEEGQTQEPGSDTAEQQFRTYNQPAFFVYKPPKKPTADSPVSI